MIDPEGTKIDSESTKVNTCPACGSTDVLHDHCGGTNKVCESCGHQWVGSKPNAESPAWVELIPVVADQWFRPDGSPKTRAMTQSMIIDTMMDHNLPLQEAAQLFEKAMLHHKGKYTSHVVGGPKAYWEVVARMTKEMDIEATIAARRKYRS